MRSFRPFLLLSFAVFFFGGVNVSAQTFPPQFQQPFPPQQPAQSQQAVSQQAVQQQQRMQQAPIQQQPIQVQPVQTPLFGTQGQMGMNAGQTQAGQMPAGQTNVWQPNMGQPTTMQQPVLRVATANPGQPVGGQPISLYAPSGTNLPQAPQTVQPTAQGISQGMPLSTLQGAPPGMQHVGRAEPANRIIPFWLTPEEQRELDEFLVRWERYSATIQRYEVNFNVFVHDPTIPDAQPGQPHRIAFGYFKYNANPRRFVYALEGEWQGTPRRQVRRDDRNLHIIAERTVIDDRSVHHYDYNAQVVRQINVPPEMFGRGIADSPLPLIFGARADDLKRRFSMRIVPVPGREDLIWLHARPLLIEDQREFKELEILLDRRNLTAQGLRQWDINGKTHRAFQLETPQINRNTPFADFIGRFTSDVPRGWTRQIEEWTPPSPPPSPSIQQPHIANPPLHHPPQQHHHNEVPLYRAQ